MTERWRASLDRGQDLSVQIFEKNGGIVLGFRGTLVDPDPSTWLLPLFKQVGTRLNEIGGSTITLDFTLLRYMNATSFRVFARWINEERTRNQGKVVIKGRNEHFWQRVQLPALRVVGGERVQIEFES